MPPDATKPESDFKVETVELGKETVDEHPCVKNQVVVIDKEGTKRESTVWNASDLKDFPIKIVTNEHGTATTLLFKDVQLAPPDASLFDPPAGFKRYDSMMGMIQETMMKKMSR
jgi:hypothetical protein